MERKPMSRVALVTYEPALSQPPTVPVEPLLDPANEEFDDALEQVAASYFERQTRPIRARAAEQDGSRGPSSPSAISTAIGTGAIAAAGYRFVLQPPDDPKLRPLWYSRFPLR
jgi:hypothetical protein